MAHDIDTTIGLDGSGFTGETEKMGGAVKRFARSLETQFARMSRSKDSFAAYRAGLLGMNEAERGVIRACH